ncbi:MAG: hypothetical protein IJV73_06165 [Clostridia bacterium]|nr:hypothetical protein [Clostridia bacterium]
MKQSYNTPCVELLVLAIEDVISTSLGTAASGVGNNEVIDCSNWLNNAN